MRHPKPSSDVMAALPSLIMNDYVDATAIPHLTKVTCLRHLEVRTHVAVPHDVAPAIAQLTSLTKLTVEWRFWPLDQMSAP
mmetsp:Transcript_17801/g.38330  ORF Transcript_17801/g.38330 Transcript_17801/m.38330 type:complete len:81 (+) Transcript_17801:137-379(+)